MKPPLGVILAGGRARRMGGGDKGLLPLGQGRVIDHVLARFGPQVPELVINANGDPARFLEFGLAVIPDSIAEFPGPLAGVLAGMDHAADAGFETLVTVAADTPFLPADLVPRLMQASEGMAHPLALAATDGRHPTFGLWPVALREDLRASLVSGLRKVVMWTDKHGAAEALFLAAPFDPFFNVNTPEDLAQAEAILA